MKKLLLVLALAMALAAPALAQVCPGPTYAGTTRNYKFTTRQFSDAVPTTGASLAVKAYKSNSTSTEITTGITTTFTSGFDAVAGLVNLTVDYSADGTFYASGSDVSFIITTGTVGGTSVVGETICNVHILPAPATADIPDVNVKNINNATAATPGATGGMLIAGSNAATTFASLTSTGSFTISDGLLIGRSTSNTSAITATGNGTGSGAVFTSGSGATGDGAKFTSAATAGQGFSATGNGIGHGFLATSGSGATGDGFKAISAATNGNGFNGVGTGTGADIKGSGLEQLVSKAVASSFSSTVVNNSVLGYLSTSSATTNYDRTTMSSEAAYTNAPTVAGMATAIWQDTTSGDFTTGSSIGKSLFTGSAPGTGGGLLLAGSNAATTFATLTSTGAFTVNSVVNVPQTGDNYARLGAPAGASVSADIAAVKALLPTALVGGRMDSSLGAVASGAITRAGFAADTGLQTIRSNTAAAGGSTSITLDASASASNSYYLNDKVYITGGTGVGQARTISAYNGTSKVATVTAWVTNPDNTSTFAILPDDAVSGASAPTASQVATAVWQDLMAGGDFGTSSSIGKLFADNITGNAYTRLGAPAGASISADIAAAKVDTAAIKTKTDFLPSATAGAAGGVFIAGTNAATTITTGLTTHFIGTVDAVTAVNGLASNVITAASIASDADTEIENAVLNATTAGHTTAGSIGKAIGDASSAGDPWSTALPGSYASGTAGYIIGNNIQPVKTVKKGEAFTDVPIWMLSTTGAAVTGLSTSQISCQVSIDHGSWAAVTDTTETEIGLGKYVVDLSSGETNGNSISLDCSATGASHYRTNITPQR